MTVNYKFRTTPYAHQHVALDRSMDRKAYGFFMEMGTGKSKVLIDTISNLYLQGLLDFALIVAPKGVYKNWVTKEIPEHFPLDVPHRVIHWVASPNTKQLLEMKSVSTAFAGVTMFVMNTEAFSHIKGKNAGEWLGKNFGGRGLIAVDESTTIKNHGAKRTKSLIRISRAFTYRRILTGSPVTKAPMDIYSQAEFLGHGLLGFDSFYAFRGRYAIVKRRVMGRNSFDEVVGYRNLDELAEVVNTFSYRVLKKDCLDLPDKIYTKRFVTPTPEQKRMYNDLKTDAYLMLEEGYITAPIVITQMLRLQQILSGHLPLEDGPTQYFDSGKMDALLQLLEETDGKVIIWSRFRYDIQQITGTLQQLYGMDSAASYYGDTTSDDRTRAVENFQNPEHPLRFFIGNPATAGYGITLTEAHTVVYYANSFDLEHRIQSEDRCHRIGQKNAVTYVDLIVEDSIDEKIVDALRDKIDLSAKVLGELAREWLA